MGCYGMSCLKICQRPMCPLNKIFGFNWQHFSPVCSIGLCDHFLLLLETVRPSTWMAQAAQAVKVIPMRWLNVLRTTYAIRLKRTQLTYTWINRQSTVHVAVNIYAFVYTENWLWRLWIMLTRVYARTTPPTIRCVRTEKKSKKGKFRLW